MTFFKCVNSYFFIEIVTYSILWNLSTIHVNKLIIKIESINDEIKNKK